MRILYINTLYAPQFGGGAEVTLKTLVESMAARGNEVAVLTAGQAPGLAREEVDGICVWRAGVRNLYFHHGKDRPPAWKRQLWHALDMYNPLMKPYVREVVQEFRPDVASCHNLAGWSISAWDALADCGVPIVQVLHDQYLLCPTSTMFRNAAAPCGRQCVSCRLLRLPHAVRSNRVTAVVGVSRFIRDKLLARGYFRNSPIKEFIYNARNFPFDPSRFRPRVDDGTVVFGYIGTLAPSKGIELLLKVFCKSAPSHWRLLVAGSGKAAYEALLKATFQDPRITFLGYTKQEDFFCGIDLLVVPSLWEDTFPGVVFESLMFGVPVLGSWRGGIPEMVVPGENGLLFDPEAPADMMNRLSEMASGLDAWRGRRSLIQESGTRFRDEAAWSVRWLEVYKSCHGKSL